MVPLRFLEYELNEQPDQIYNRLSWAVEEMEISWLDRLNKWKSHPNTNKHWVGELDQRNLTFKLEESEGALRGKLGIVLKGEVEMRASYSLVKIKLGLDNSSFMWVLLIYLMSVGLITEAVYNSEFDGFFGLIIFLIAYPLVGIVYIITQMKSAERKLDVLFA